MIHDESVFIEVTAIDDYAGIDLALNRLHSAALAEYHGAKINDLSGEDNFSVMIDGRVWPTSISQIITDDSVGIRFLQVTSLPPREQEEDDDIADGYSYTLERIPGQRKWQVLPGSFRIEPLFAQREH